MVEKHGKKWRYDFLKDGIRYKKGGYRTKPEAIEAEAKQRAGARTINTDFLRLCNARLEDVEARRSKHHFKETKALIETLMQSWGDYPTITTEDVEEYLRDVAKVSKTLANRHLKMIKALFYHGVKRHWFYVNPAVGVPFYGVDKKRKYIPPLSDIEKVINIAKPEQKTYLTVISFTLARVREINNLKWEDVHEDYLILRSRKTKTGDVVERKIPMIPRVKETIDSLESKGEYVFINPTTDTKYDYRDKFIRNLCTKAEVKPFMYHALRHYGASKLASEGVPITDIQALLGHARATTTDIYLQSLRGSLVESMNKLDSPKDSPNV
jgi:integrase